MSRAKRLLELMDENAERAPDALAICNAFNDRLARLGFEGISVGEIQVDMDGSVVVDFTDPDGDLLTVLFIYDDEGAAAVILDNDDDEYLTFDLDPVAPSILPTSFGTYLNLIDLSWLNRSTMGAILSAGSDWDEEDATPIKLDAYGNVVMQTESLDPDALRKVPDAQLQKLLATLAPNAHDKTIAEIVLAIAKEMKRRGLTESKTIRSGKRRMRMPIVASKPRHKASYRITAAVQRLPRKSRKHALKVK